MGRFTIYATGLALLFLGAISFLGCSDSGFATRPGITLVTTTQVPKPVAPTAGEVAAADVAPADTVAATAKLEGLTILAPAGMQLQVASGAGITFSGANISNTKNTLPLQQSGANLATGGLATLPAGQVTMTLPPITLAPNNKATTGTLTLSDLTVTFTVTGATWTLPDTYSFMITRRSDGLYVLGRSIVTMSWNAATGQVPPASGLLTLTLLNNGAQMGIVSRPLAPTGNNLTLTGTNTTVAFNELRANIVIP